MLEYKKYTSMVNRDDGTKQSYCESCTEGHRGRVRLDCRKTLNSKRSSIFITVLSISGIRIEIFISKDIPMLMFLQYSLDSKKLRTKIDEDYFQC